MRKHRDQLHVQFARGVAHQFRDGFCHLQLLLGGRPRKFPDARFRLFDDAGHYADGLDGILPRCGFRRKHHRVRAVENRIGHVRSFRARRPGVLRHRLQHLRRRNHRTPEFPGSRNNRFLNHRHALRVHLYAQVAPRHHHAVGGPQNRVEIVDSLRLLQLCDHRSVSPRAANQLFRQQHVFRAPHKAHRNVICAVFQREFQVGAVFWRQRGNAQFDSRQVDPFVLAKRAAVHDLANHLTPADLIHAQFDQSIREQDAVAAVHFMR